MSPVSPGAVVAPTALPFASLAGTYSFLGEGAAAPSAALGNGTLRLAPFYVPRRTVLDRIGVSITVAGDPATMFRPAIYRDDGNIWPGAVLLDPGTAPGDAIAMPELSVPNTPNLLTPNEASIETDATAWFPNTNCAVARSTAAALDGLASLSVTSSAAGDMQARTTRFQAAGIPVIGGATYTATMAFLAATAGRTVQIQASCYDAAGVSTGQFPTFASGADVTTGWTLLSGSAVIPVGVAFIALKAIIVATAAASEVHYIDKIGVFPGTQPAGAWAVQGSGVLDPGNYWLGGAVQNAPGIQPTIQAVSEFPMSPLVPTASVAASFNGTWFGVQTGSIQGQLPATFQVPGSSGLAGVMPRVFVRAA